MDWLAGWLTCCEGAVEHARAHVSYGHSRTLLLRTTRRHEHVRDVGRVVKH